MPTVDATAGGAASNSYISLNGADAYFDTRLYTDTWTAAGEDDKARAVIMATRLLDTWFDWYGAVTSLQQALLWPRTGVIKPGIVENAAGSVGNPWGEPFAQLLDPHTIPARIEQATAEMALQLLVSDRTADSDQETQNLRALRVGPIALDFGSAVAKPIPDAVLTLVSSLGTQRTKSGSGAVSIYRG